jgi:hypothetical protein
MSSLACFAGLISLLLSKFVSFPINLITYHMFANGRIRRGGSLATRHLFSRHGESVLRRTRDFEEEVPSPQ